MPARDFHAVRGKHLNISGDVGVGELGPLPILSTITLPGIIGWRFPTSGTLSTQGGETS